VKVPDFVADPSENLYEQVADHLAARIARGDLGPGTMLPNERKLAAEYGVAVGTARKATELLEKRGMIKIRPCKGKFVLATSDQVRRGTTKTARGAGTPDHRR
jgi:GntR family transcriptional regulator